MDLIANFKKGDHVVVAVDGPAGSGKSTVCAMVSQRLGWTYVNTGFLYRAVGLISHRRGLNLDQDTDLLKVVHDVSEQLQWNPESQEVWFEGEDLAPYLYDDEIGQIASAIAKNARLREALLPLQRRLALNASKPAIIDGRDIGTVVFPDADLKIFLTASIEERANRRLAQIGSDFRPEEKQAAFERLKASLTQRDRQDEDRGTAPLRQADDAVRLDTSDMNMDEVIERVIALIQTLDLKRE